MELTEEQIIEFNKKFVALLAPLAGKLAGECEYCDGKGRIKVHFTDLGHSWDDCPYCAKLREIAGMCWHEDHAGNWCVASRCVHCNVKNYSKWSGDVMGHTHPNPQFTIQSLMLIFKTMGIQTDFIEYVESDYPHEVNGETVYGTTQKEMVDILTIHDQFMKVAVSYLEVVTSK